MNNSTGQAEIRLKLFLLGMPAMKCKGRTLLALFRLAGALRLRRAVNPCLLPHQSNKNRNTVEQAALERKAGEYHHLSPGLLSGPYAR